MSALLTARRCSECNALVDVIAAFGSTIGPPEITCRRCGALLDSRRREWTDHSAPARVWVFVLAALRWASHAAAALAAFFLAGVAMVLAGGSSAVAAWMLMVGVPAAAALGAVRTVLESRREICQSLARTRAKAPTRPGDGEPAAPLSTHPACGPSTPRTEARLAA